MLFIHIVFLEWTIMLIYSILNDIEQADLFSWKSQRCIWEDFLDLILYKNPFLV